MKIPPHTVQADYASPLGRMILAATNQHLIGVWFEHQAHEPDLSACPVEPHHPILQQVIGQLTQYFAGQRRTFDLPLDLSCGTPFQQSVWQALQGIAPGSTCSYGALSAQIGRPTAVRAVAAAVGRNPLSIVVPCHRVLGANGSLTGYAGGLARKSALLQLEQTR